MHGGELNVSLARVQNIGGTGAREMAGSQSDIRRTMWCITTFRRPSCPSQGAFKYFCGHNHHSRFTRVFGKMGTDLEIRTKRYLQNHVVYQRTERFLRNPLASPVRGARQNGHAPSRAFGWAQKAIYAGSIAISLDAGYRGDAEDFQPDRQLIRRLLYSPTGPSIIFFFGVVHN